MSWQQRHTNIQIQEVDIQTWVKLNVLATEAYKYTNTGSTDIQTWVKLNVMATEAYKYTNYYNLTEMNIYLHITFKWSK